MTLIERIKSDRMQARKEKDTHKLQWLTTLLGECERVAKEPTDDQVIKVINKSIAGNKERLKQAEDKGSMSPELYSELTTENTFLNSYLPSEMFTESQLESIFKFLWVEDKTRKLGDFMSILKSKYPGQYDGRQASEIAKKVLSEVQQQ